MPVVPCAHVTTSWEGAASAGRAIRPVTAISVPSTACEWYMTRHNEPWRPGAETGSLEMRVPGAPAGRGEGTV